MPLGAFLVLPLAGAAFFVDGVLAFGLSTGLFFAAFGGASVLSGARFAWALLSGAGFSVLGASTTAGSELAFALLFAGAAAFAGASAAGAASALGAAFFMLMEHQLSAWTEAWALYFGLIFIAFVLFAPEGIWGLATRLRASPRA